VLNYRIQQLMRRKSPTDRPAYRSLALGSSERRNDLVTKQACAAVGQSLLMHAYEALFRAHRIKIAQVLLTEEDFTDWDRY